MIRAVIDSNVLISSLISPGGNEAHIIRVVRDGLNGLCLSAEIVFEHFKALGREKLDFSVGEIAAFRDRADYRSDLSHPVAQPVQSSDPGDTAFISCAITAKAGDLVTGNRRHFPAPRYGSALVVNAAELLTRLKQDT